MTMDHFEGFVAIHASPPCQQYSTALKHLSKWQPMLIEVVREMLLRRPGIYWVIENVPGSPLPSQSTLLGAHGVELCGTMFGLKIQRHRLFETNFPVGPPRGCDHTERVMNFYKTRDRPKVPGKTPAKVWAEEMGVEWMHGKEVRNAIPPVYTEWIGRQLYAEAYPEAAAAQELQRVREADVHMAPGASV